MALRFIDGFDHVCSNADLARKWTSVVNTPTLGSSTPATRNGVGQWLRFPGAAESCSKTIDSQASWVVGFALYVPVIGAGTIMRLLDSGTTQVDLRLNGSGTFSVTRNGSALTNGTSTYVLSAATWVYVEFRVTIANSIGANTCKVRVNGVDIITVATSQDTQNTANATANQIFFGASLGMHIDDLYVCDGTGGTNNDFLGDVRVATLYPSGAGNSTQWTPSAGSNFQCVDEAQANGDTDFVSSSTPTQKDTYAFDDLAGSGTIFGVATNLFARKDDAGSRSIAPVVRSGGTDYDGTTVSINDSYTIHQEIRETDPATAWTYSGVNNMEAGAKLVS